MKVYTKLILSIATGEVLYEESFEYSGPIARCDMGGDSPPPPSPEERELQSEQADLLRLQRAQLEEQLGLQDLLAPFLYEELGIRPEFSTPGLSEADQARLGDLQGQLAALESRPAVQFYNQTGKRIGRPGSEGARDIDRYLELRDQISSLEQRRDADPSIVGFEDIPPTEAELLREEIELALLERSQAALRGELPISPTLERELSGAEELLRERLRRNLGPGFETSTPGESALSDFTKRAIEVREGARRGELTLSEQLSLARSGQMFQQGAANRAQLAALPTMRPDFTNLIASFGDPLNRMAQDRWRQFMAESQRGSFGSTLGQILGIGVGSIAGGAGATIGSKIGEDLFKP